MQLRAVYDSTQMLSFAKPADEVTGTKELICMPNSYLNVDIYFNLISYPRILHRRLLWQSHINLWLVNIQTTKSPNS